MLKLSIIIPIYNVANYLERCIRTLEDQDIPKEVYELICINDGSPDNSRDIIENLQNEFLNIVLLNQKNMGVSLARNNGMEMARGKFLLMIDPDDFVLPKTISRVINRAEDMDLDVLYLGYEIFDSSGELIWKTDFRKQENNIFSGQEAYFSVRGKEIKDPDRSVSVLFNRSLINQFRIKYLVNVPYLEDGLFVAKVLSVAKKVGFCSTQFYQRTHRQGSATHSELFYSKKAMGGFILAARDICNFAKNSELNQDQQFLINHVVVKMITLPLIAAINGKSITAFFRAKVAIKKAGFRKLPEKGPQYNYYHYAVNYNISPFWFAFKYLLE